MIKKDIEEKQQTRLTNEHKTDNILNDGGGADSRRRVML